MKTKAALLELFELLETYAPAWYSEEQRDRAIAALNYRDKEGLRLVKPPTANQPRPTSAEVPSLLQQPSSLIQ